MPLEDKLFMVLIQLINGQWYSLEVASIN